MIRILVSTARRQTYPVSCKLPAYCGVFKMTLKHLTTMQKNLLPADKHDEEAVLHLQNLDETSIEPLIPELLAWIQDLNWPIAGPVSSLLLMHRRLLVSPIREVLQGDDDPWKANCLDVLVEHLSQDQQLALLPELERIANHPTEGEILEEADGTAREILQDMKQWDEENSRAA
jgi:hypothetical protein